MDCFAEPVIGRRFAPTRWLAMTVQKTLRVSAGAAPTVRHHPRRRMIQYSRDIEIDPRSCGVLDTRVRGYDDLL
jgi:hypothetical protein